MSESCCERVGRPDARDDVPQLGRHRETGDFGCSRSGSFRTDGEWPQNTLITDAAGNLYEPHQVEGRGVAGVSSSSCRLRVATGMSALSTPSPPFAAKTDRGARC
jgi:hypothetical protein